MAGQLGLDPPIMTLPDGDRATELEQALQHGYLRQLFYFVIYCTSYVHRLRDSRYRTSSKVLLSSDLPKGYICLCI